MKHTILTSLLISLLVLASCSDNSQQKVEPPTRQGWDSELPILKGDVESITITQYAIRRASGKIVKFAEESKYLYRFNQRGDVVERVEYDNNNMPSHRCLYTYDSENRMVEAAWYKNDTLMTWKALYAYDDKGRMIEEAGYNSDGSKLDFTLYTYDAMGRKTEAACYSGEGVLQLVSFLQYDENGLLKEDARYYGDGKLGYKYAYNYNESNCLVEIEEYDYEGPVSATKYIRNDEDRILAEESYDARGTLEDRKAYIYDTKGNVVTVLPTDDFTEPYGFMTEYDISYR